MTPTEAKRHAAHLCDVWPLAEDVEHIGVIDRLRAGRARVSGHPQYGAQWFDVAELDTSCKIPD